MKKTVLTFLFVFTTTAVALGRGGFFAAGSDEAPAGKYIGFEAIPSHLQVEPGGSFHVALDVRIADGWVYYSPDPGEIGKPASLTVRAPGFRVGEILWPVASAKPVDLGDRVVDIYSYTKRAVVYVPLSVPPGARPGRHEIVIIPHGQVCGDSCIDIQPPAGGRAVFVNVETTVAVGRGSRVNPAWADDPALRDGLKQAGAMAPPRSAGPAGRGGEAMSFWAAIGVALLGGLVLNIMPCVLPVIPIRILSIVEMAGGTGEKSRRRFVTMGLAFVGGMMLFFAAIAALNVALKLTVGGSFDINQGFQSPPVVIALAMLVVALAANLFGIFNVIVPSRVAGLELSVQARRAGHMRSAGMGLMLAVLATPCSFAYLAAALAYAQLASIPAGTGVILAVGVGMSAPHLLLTAFPALVDRLPRPGRWMELFKQATGFVLLLVAVWLLGTLRGGGSSYPFWVIAWGVILVMGLWMWTTWVRYDAGWKSRLLVRGLAVVLAGGTGLWMLRPPPGPLIKAEAFSTARVEQARDEGRIVVVKFTADWCVKCLQQDYSIFNTPQIADAFRERGVVYLKADVTNGDSPAAKWMRSNGYGARIPMTLIYPPAGAAGPPIGGELTAEMLISKLQQAGGLDK